MVTARSPKTHHHNGNGSARGDAPGSRAAVFVDLDRTLLRGASGLVLSAAMHVEGLFEGRRSLPGERIVYGLYDLMGESLAFMAMVRLAPRFVRGWPVEAVCRAGELAGCWVATERRDEAASLATDDDAAAACRVSGHGVDRGAAAEQAADEVHLDLLLQRRHAGLGESCRGKTAGEVDRCPERHDTLVESIDGRLVGETAGDAEHDVLVVA